MSMDDDSFTWAGVALAIVLLGLFAAFYVHCGGKGCPPGMKPAVVDGQCLCVVKPT